MDDAPIPPWQYVYKLKHKPNPSGADPRGKGKKFTSKGTKIEEINTGANYSDDEQEWIKAVQSFLSKHRRYPTMQEAFAIAIALGYRKEESPSE